MTDPHSPAGRTGGMLPGRLFWWLSLAAATGVVGWLVFEAARPIGTDDLWWHLKLGEWLLESGFPDTDPLVIQASPGAPFLHEWLFQASVAVLERLGGLPALRMAHAAAVLVCLASVACFAQRLGRDRAITLALLLLFVFFAYHRLVQFRPHLVTISCFYLVLWLLIDRPLTVLRVGLAGALMVIWTNSHGTAPLIMPFLGAYLAALAWAGSPAGYLWKHAGVLALMTGLIALNPRGVAVFGYYFAHDAINPLGGVVDEWGHWWSPPDRPGLLPWSSPLLGIVYLGLAGMVVIGAARAGSRGRLMDSRCLFLLLSGGLALAAAAYAVRFVWMLPLAGLAAAVLIRPPSPLLRPALPLAIALLALVHLAGDATAPFRYRGPLSTYLQAQVAPQYPGRAADFLAKLPGGHLYHPYPDGGYLAWRLPGDFRIMLYGRLDAYPESVARDHLAMLAVEPGLQARIERYGLDFALLRNDDRHYRLAYALGLLGWQAIYHDPGVRILATPGKAAHPAVRAAVTSHFPAAAEGDSVTALAEASFLTLVNPGLDALTPERWGRLLRQALLNHFFHAADLLVQFGHGRFGSRVSFEGVRGLCAEHAALEARLAADPAATAASRDLCVNVAALASEH